MFQQERSTRYLTNFCIQFIPNYVSQGAGDRQLPDQDKTLIDLVKWISWFLIQLFEHNLFSVKKPFRLINFSEMAAEKPLLSSYMKTWIKLETSYKLQGPHVLMVPFVTFRPASLEAIDTPRCQTRYFKKRKLHMIILYKSKQSEFFATKNVTQFFFLKSYNMGTIILFK